MSKVYLYWSAGSGDEQRLYRESNPDDTTEKPSFPSEYTQIDTLGMGVEEYVDNNAPDAGVVYYAITTVEGTTESDPQVNAAGIESSRPDDGGGGGGGGDIGGGTSTPPLFDDWTTEWDSSQDDWSVVNKTSNVDNAVLELSAASAGLHALKWDNAGTPQDAEIVALVRVPSNDDQYPSWCRLFARASGLLGDRDAYFVDFESNDPRIRIRKFVNGGGDLLVQQTLNSLFGEWIYVRFRVSSNNLKLRYWKQGNSEPSTWDLETTDSDVTGSGWVGVGGFPTDLQQWDWVSIGTGGDSAQLPP